MIEEYTEFNMDEIKSLYDAVGWKAYTDNMTRLMKGYKNSLKVLAAFRDDELIGIIRAVGDGLTIVFIQDILVMPNERRKGVGKSLLRAMIDLYPEVRQISEVGCCGFMRLL